jgi:hypothetical protein
MAFDVTMARHLDRKGLPLITTVSRVAADPSFRKLHKSRCDFHLDARTKMALTLLINLWFVCDLGDVSTNAICMQIQFHHACGADNERGKKKREGRGGKIDLSNFSTHSITKLTIPSALSHGHSLFHPHRFFALMILNGPFSYSPMCRVSQRSHDPFLSLRVSDKS